ncbi:MAG TPA: hypothetical protein VJT15_09140 [Pyrinomonadaceae bacterium]|nr:hypothetical protein [Pyrinomonadaceae bacterium]
MTPEQRLDRTERILKLMIQAGYRTRKELREEARQQKENFRENREMIHMLIQSQMETSEKMSKLADSKAELDKEMAKLAESDRLMREMFTSRKRRNGKSD